MKMDLQKTWRFVGGDPKEEEEGFFVLPVIKIKDGRLFVLRPAR